MQAAQKPRRVILFDELRGVMILSMLAYHICYDLAEVVRLPGMGWFYSDAAGWWQLSICGTFILISGACCFYSKNNLKRGLRLFLLGMLFTLVTALIVPDLLIVFGLLHFLGIAVLLAVPLKRLFELIPPVWGMAACLLLFWLFYHVQNGLPIISRCSRICFCFGRECFWQGCGCRNSATAAIAERLPSLAETASGFICSISRWSTACCG